MNRKIFYSIFLCATMMMLPFFTSCSKDDDDDEVIEPAETFEYIYVLNSGLMNGNNASLTRYSVEDKIVTQGFFEKQNGRRLGDTGQDILVYGSKIYIAMSGESTIEVTDLDAKSIKQIKTEGEPRGLAAYEGKVYATYYNGYVARIDTASFAVDKVAVGRNPEQLTVANKKLYVANSGGLDYPNYDKTVSVIDIATFKETKKIEVIINPCNITSDDNGNVYVVSVGNYGDIPNTLQKIAANTDVVSVVSDINGTYLATIGNTLYSIFAQWGEPAFFYSYNTANNTVISNNFIGTTSVASPNFLSADEDSGDIYISDISSGYTNDGDMYVFDKTGKFLFTFETGLTPMKAVKVKK